MWHLSVSKNTGKSNFVVPRLEELLIYLLVASVALLSFANGANDNFKGVATLWGAGRTSYAKALAWATGFTLLGSNPAVWFATGLVAKFNGSNLLSSDIYTQLPFVGGVALGVAATVLLASRLGFPVSTTHALTGGLIGAGIAARRGAGQPPRQRQCAEERIHNDRQRPGFEQVGPDARQHKRQHATQPGKIRPVKPHRPPHCLHRAPLV